MMDQTVSHYRILEKLGEGGMGVVYKAEDTVLHRFVALKFLTPELTRDQAAKTRFMHEARAASALDHPNIAVVHEIDETPDGRSFICMGYYEGKTLKDLVEGGPLGMRESARIALQITEGLQRAHEANIIHRDIKPANIIVTPRGEVKIVDFGIAKLGTQTRFTKAGTTAGTVAYMSPEQARGDTVDARSDLFSLGVVLFEMVTGQRPFVGDHDAVVLYNIVNVDPPAPSTVRPEVDADLERIILRLLEKDPAHRYQSASELRVDLQQFLSPGQTGKLPIVRPLRQWSWRSITAPVVALLVVAILIVPRLRTMVGDVLGFKGVPTERHLAVLPFINISNDSTNQVFCDGLLETLTSAMTQLQTPGGRTWVVASSEVRLRNVKSASEAKRLFGATIAVTGSSNREGHNVHLTINTVDANTSRQLESYSITRDINNLAGIEVDVVSKLASMLSLDVQPQKVQTVAGQGTMDSRAYDFYLRGRGYLGQYQKVEKVDNAIILFKEALKVDSLYALAYAALGESYWRKYELTNDTALVNPAVTACRTAIGLDNTLAPAHVTMGLIDEGSGRYERAVVEFTRARSLDPFSAGATRGLAAAYEALNDAHKAEQTFKNAITLSPDYWAGYNDLGAFYYRHARYEEASKAFQTVVNLTPDNFRGYNNLGGTLFQLHHWDQADGMFQKSIAVEPNYVAYSQLGTLYFYQRRYRESAVAYEDAIRLRGTDYRVWGFLGAAYYWSGADTAKVRQSYRKAVALAETGLTVNPRDASLLSDVSEYYALMGQSRKARATIHKALSLEPTNTDIIGKAGSIFEELGNRDEALTWISKAIKQGYSPAEFENDPAMGKLREDPRYKKLTEGGASEKKE